METELIDLSGFSLNWFQAYVEKAEPTTTTTTTPENTTTTVLVTGSVATPQQVKYDIHLWGIAYTYTLSFPDESTPDETDEISIGFSILSGYGAYLGADATFWGITGTGGSGGGGGGEPQFGSISPETGKQESTLKGVEITAKNTTFEDDGVNEVIFVPDDGITVSNIKTTDNTTIEVDLTIAVDASLEDRTVIVSWDDPVQTVSSADVGKYFTVTE
jgi:hypothetical protein